MNATATIFNSLTEALNTAGRYFATAPEYVLATECEVRLLDGTVGVYKITRANMHARRVA